MPGLDVFAADGFSMETLTAAVNRRDYLPQRLLQLGTFEPKRVRTTKITLERKAGVLRLVQSSQRGGVPETRARTKPEVVDISVPRLALWDQILADEIQNLRAFGTQSELAQLQEIVNDRAAELRQDIEFTLENHRLGAVTGQVLDADGTTMLDLTTLWGGSANTKVQLDLASAASGALRENIEANLVRPIIRALKGMAMPNTSIRALCGDDFWDALMKNAEVRESFTSQPEAALLRNGTLFGEFRFAGVTWENYRGSDASTPTDQTVRVTADEAVLFPENVPGLFAQVFAPGDYQETVNTMGLPFYAKQAVDPQFGRFTDLEVQSNSICYCAVPEVLFKADKDA